jgi:predicted amidohydrolase YtcJ
MNARRDIDLHGPDMTLLGGKIVTVDQKASVAEALAIRDGRI